MPDESLFLLASGHNGSTGHLGLYWDYIGIEQNSPEAANHQLSRFHEKLTLLAAQPLMGQLREDLRPGLRIFVADSYVILYYPVDNGVEVVGLVHAARHIEWLFQSGTR